MLRFTLLSVNTISVVDILNRFPVADSPMYLRHQFLSYLLFKRFHFALVEGIDLFYTLYTRTFIHHKIQQTNIPKLRNPRLRIQYNQLLHIAVRQVTHCWLIFQLPSQQSSYRDLVLLEVVFATITGEQVLETFLSTLLVGVLQNVTNLQCIITHSTTNQTIKQ